MVEKLTLSSLAAALVDIPAVSMAITRSLKTYVALCCVTKRHILKWHFIVPSTRCTCVMIMAFNQLLDILHLSGGWIILAKQKCFLTGMETNLCTKFERKYVCMEHFWDLLFLIIKHGANTLHGH
jgi:hypothetical protein